jgi:peroxiredoxin Q/BCP
MSEKPRELQIGDLATEFTLRSDDGGDVSLSDFRGKRVVLYFFPKALTPG